MSEGTKHDGDKSPLILIPYEALEEIGLALQYGAMKYDNFNFCSGIAIMRLLSATGRHLWQFMWIEDKDKDSHLSHLAHAGANICMAIWMLRNKPELDNRYISKGKHVSQKNNKKKRTDRRTSSKARKQRTKK